MKKFTNLKLYGWFISHRKTWLMMKMAILLLTLNVMQVSASVFSQNTSFSINGKNLTIMQIIGEIEEQTDYRFIYRDNFLSTSRTIDLAVKDENVENFLPGLLKQFKLEYEIFENNLVVITPREDILIRGTVIDGSTNMPLAGASVVIKGTSKGTITDLEGKFELRVSSPQDVIVVSFVGLVSKEITIGEKRQFNITLEEDVTELSDVVVIGYGTVKKEDLTSSVAVVTDEEINRTPIPNLSKAIQGKASGVLVLQDGSPGGGVNMRVRGIGSITLDPDPLFVVDGIVGADINSFSPEDIESISVLKDASASAIYGANGANGVIVVTTKRGKQSVKPRVTFSTRFGTNRKTKYFDLMNADEYAEFYDSVYTRNNVVPPLAYSDEFRQFYYHGNWHEGTDWQREILQDNINQDYYFNISHGNQKSNYSLSVNYNDEEGILLKSSSRRINVRANSDFKLGKFVRVGESLSITRRENQNSSGSAWGMSIESSPLMNIYNEDNKEGYEGSQIPFDYVTEEGDSTAVLNTGGNDKFNPVAILNIPDNEFTSDGVLANAYVEFTPFEGLTLKSTPAVNAYFNDTHNWEPAYESGVRSVKTASLEQQRDKGHTLSVKNQIDYEGTFGAHYIHATALHHARKGFYSNLRGTSAGFPYEQLNVMSQSLPDGRDVTGGEGTSGELSYIGRLIYNYDSKYLLNASVRRDGSSNFGPKRRWGTFPSFSAAWKINKDFLQEVEQINMLKIRFGWGKTGNADIGGFRYQTQIASPEFFRPVFGIDQKEAYAANELWTSGNPLIKWEAAEMTNFGLDLNAFSNKIQFSAEYYIKKQSDLIMEVPISRIHGKGINRGASADPLLNIADIENKGFEFDLRYSKQEGIFTYNAFANFSTVKNEVISVPSSILSGNHITTEGHPIGSLYGFVAERIIQESDFDEEGNYLHAEPAEGIPAPGDLKFKDLNGDEKINDDDREIIGKAIPDFTYSFGFECFYKAFDFSLFLYGISDAKIYNTMRKDIECFETQDLDHNKSADWAANYYGKDGIPSTEYVRADPNDVNRNSRFSSWWVDEAAFLRIKDIQLGYTIPAHLSNRIGIQKARVYISGMNVYTFTAYKGYDPESPLNSDDPRIPGVDRNVYPIPRTLTTGIQLNL